METSGKFKTKSYKYGELALMYMTHLTYKGAIQAFGTWIKKHKLLEIELIQTGWKKGQSILTPKQVGLIIKHFGTPGY